MRYLTIGYYTVCFSPLLSMLVYLCASKLLVGRNYGWLLPIIVFTGVHLFVMSVQVCGIVLYIVGYRNEKLESKQMPLVPLFSMLLILWGVLVSWFAVGFYYSELIPWSRLSGVRELTIWDHLQFASWALKGLLWIASGLIFIVTSQFQNSSMNLLDGNNSRTKRTN